MGAVSKIRRGYNMTNPTQMKSDQGKGTDLNARPGVPGRAVSTNTWGIKQPKTDAGTNKSGGKMDFANPGDLNTWNMKQPQTSKGTAAQGGKMTGKVGSLNTWNMKQTKHDTGTAGTSMKTIKTNFPLAKDKNK